MRTHSLVRVVRSLLAVAAFAIVPVAVHAQHTDSAFVPASAPNCRVTEPPDAAGIAATPGGFAIVFPRNDALTAPYTGCKVLWIADTDVTPRLATLYFEQGRLARVVAYDIRDPKGGEPRACDVIAGRSLTPGGSDAACRGIVAEELFALRVPTWPKSCLTKPDAAVCTADPR